MKKYGRAFNHLEDLTFFYGSDGALEALQHLKEINDDASSMRMKWDGGLQIYWGRETEDGPLIFTGHNGWSRGIKSTSGSELFEFITKHSGKNNLTVDESVNRIFFASEFASLYEIFDKATQEILLGLCMAMHYIKHTLFHLTGSLIYILMAKLVIILMRIQI